MMVQKAQKVQGFVRRKLRQFRLILILIAILCGLLYLINRGISVEYDLHRAGLEYVIAGFNIHGSLRVYGL